MWSKSYCFFYTICNYFFLPPTLAVMLLWGRGCVRKEDRPLISCFPSLGKGGALRCCPCFLMSALETTKTNPLWLPQPYTDIFLPTEHLMHLKVFVPKGYTYSLVHPCYLMCFSFVSFISPLRKPRPSFSIYIKLFPWSPHRKPLARYWKQLHHTIRHKCSKAWTHTHTHTSL